MPQKPKQFYAIACCLLLIGNVSFGMHLVVCKTGPDISVEFAHSPHCGASDDQGHHSSAGHDHHADADFSKSCTPCSDIQLMQDYHFSKAFPHYTYFSPASCLPMKFKITQPACNPFSSDYSTTTIFTGYNPAFIVLRI